MLDAGDAPEDPLDGGDDPVLVFYQARVQDILKADTTDAGTVRAQYEARRKKRDGWVARDTVEVV